MTPVIFRRERPKNGDVFALFPTIPGNYYGLNCTCYQHIGQHSSADYSLCIRASRPATPNEYADLQAELENLGYDDLKVCQRETPAMQKERRFHYDRP